VGVDIEVRELRYGRRFGTPLVNASGFELPFPDASFSCVLCSEVMEHVPKESQIIEELCRVLKPGGRLVIGARQDARWDWVRLEKFHAHAGSGGYAAERIAHYTGAELLELLGRQGLTHEDSRYIGRGELVMAFRRSR
jgi:ubiquinone/menaquinone biosynthesis C-methylase UbiE